MCVYRHVYSVYTKYYNTPSKRAGISWLCSILHLHVAYNVGPTWCHHSVYMLAVMGVVGVCQALEQSVWMVSMVCLAYDVLWEACVTGCEKSMRVLLECWIRYCWWGKTSFLEGLLIECSSLPLFFGFFCCFFSGFCGQFEFYRTLSGKHCNSRG